jgi:hypothetical protein
VPLSGLEILAAKRTSVQPTSDIDEGRGEGDARVEHSDVFARLDSMVR